MSNHDHLIIRNIAELVVMPKGPVHGRAMRTVARIPNAAIFIHDGLIEWFGPEASYNGPADLKAIDAQTGCVVPGLIDCHTHTAFAGTREKEFAQRIEGRSYEDIARSGGGIVVTVDATRNATFDELVELALARLRRMLANGVTTVEIKSGYGLTVEDELKILRVIRRLGEVQPIELVPTYLAAHTTPREFVGRPDDYLDAVFDESVLATIQREQLAEFCDVFCERTAFTIEQSRRVFVAASKFGMRAKVHADQLSQMGASRLAVEVRAISADHLEKTDEGAIAALNSSSVIPVVLPGCSFFLGVPYAPARKLIEADLPVALATDFNPGSSLVESLPLVMSIACTQMRLTPAETLVAATANAAAAVDRHSRVGAIAIGMQADLTILDVPNLDRWLYEPGRSCVRTVMKRGRLVHQRND
ncbi:MAG: imidazolonepropionase [Planctomycetota bacterium]